ncbi:MAG: acyl-CoA dehydrogenase [Burkholderiaceae bacterium]
MRFESTQEQAMIAETLDRLLNELWDKSRAHEPGARHMMREAVWLRLGELGLLGAVLPERWGGIDGGPGECLAMARVVGRHAADLPVLSGVMMAAGALLELDGSALPFPPEAIGAGSVRLALGVLETERRFATDPRRLRAMADGDGWRLDGAKQHVLDGTDAHWWVVSAAIGDGPVAETGLFIVAADAAGATSTAYPAVGGARLAHLRMDSVRVSGAALLARGAPADDAIERAMRRARFWACGEVLGGCEAALAQTIDYLRIREQFGRTLASFQALQHRLADAHAELELLRSQVLGARLALEEDPAGARSACDLAAACAMAAEVGDLIGREAIQLHGAIGMTQELGVGRYLMRNDFLWRLLGDGQFQRERLLAALPAIEALA